MYSELETLVHQIMQASIANSEVMGVNLLVEKDGETVLYAEEGFADRETGRKITRGSIFRLYSQTKPVTAAAAMLLMQRGEIDLCQPVSDFLPAYAHLKVAKDGKLVDAVRPMLVHDLLRMTSGLVYPDDVTVSGHAADQVFKEACARLYGDKPMTTRELADRMAACPLLFEPGTSWNYGTSADVLGAVIEVVSGKRFSEFLRDELFAPLEMNDTAFWVPEDKQSRLVSAYETVAVSAADAAAHSQPAADAATHSQTAADAAAHSQTAADAAAHSQHAAADVTLSQPDGSRITLSQSGCTRAMIKYTGDNLAIMNGMKKAPAYEAGGAGLASTLDDYMKFARMLRNDGRVGGCQLLKPETVRFFTGAGLMPAQQAAFENWIGLDGFSYGNLLRICKKPDCSGLIARKGEYGWDGWLGMYFANFPKENMTLLMGTQKKDSGTFALTRKLRNAVLAGIG